MSIVYNSIIPSVRLAPLQICDICSITYCLIRSCTYVGNAFTVTVTDLFRYNITIVPVTVCGGSCRKAALSVFHCPGVVTCSTSGYRHWLHTYRLVESCIYLGDAFTVMVTSLYSDHLHLSYVYVVVDVGTKEHHHPHYYSNYMMLPTSANVTSVPSHTV